MVTDLCNREMSRRLELVHEQWMDRTELLNQFHSFRWNLAMEQEHQLRTQLREKDAAYASISHDLDGIHHMYSKVLEEYALASERDRTSTLTTWGIVNHEFLERLDIVEQALDNWSTIATFSFRYLDVAHTDLALKKTTSLPTHSISSREIEDTEALKQQVLKLQASLRGHEAYSAALQQSVEQKDKAYSALSAELSGLKDIYGCELDQLHRMVESGRAADRERAKLFETENDGRMSVLHDQTMGKMECMAAECHSNVAHLRATMGSMEGSLRVLQKEVTDARASDLSAKQHAAMLQSTLLAQQSQLQHCVQERDDYMGRLRAAVEDHNTECSGLRQSLAQKCSELSRVSAEADALSNAVGEMRSTIQAMQHDQQCLRIENVEMLGRLQVMRGEHDTGMDVAAELQSAVLERTVKQDRELQDAASALRYVQAGNRRDLEASQRELGAARDALVSVQRELDTSKKGLVASQETLVSVRQELAASHRNAAASQEALASVQHEFTALQRESAVSSKVLTTAQREATTLRQELTASQRELRASQESILTVRHELATAHRNVATSEAALATARGELAASQQALAAARGELSMSRAHDRDLHALMEAELQERLEIVAKQAVGVWDFAGLWPEQARSLEELHDLYSERLVMKELRHLQEQEHGHVQVVMAGEMCAYGTCCTGSKGRRISPWALVPE